jgi:hypothetical protein
LCGRSPTLSKHEQANNEPGPMYPPLFGSCEEACGHVSSRVSGDRIKRGWQKGSRRCTRKVGGDEGGVGAKGEGGVLPLEGRRGGERRAGETVGPRETVGPPARHACACVRRVCVGSRTQVWVIGARARLPLRNSVACVACVACEGSTRAPRLFSA